MKNKYEIIKFISKYAIGKSITERTVKQKILQCQK